MKIKLRIPADWNVIVLAIKDLRMARDRLKMAHATKAAKAVSRALKSAEGALRHVERRVFLTATNPPLDWREAYPVGALVEVKTYDGWKRGTVGSHYASGEGPAISVNIPGHRVEYFSEPIKHRVRKVKT